MSETIPPDEAQTARAAYDRMLAETRKFSAEQNKLAEEAGKLASEARKLDRDRKLLPWQVLVTMLGAGAVIGGLMVRLLTGH